MIPALPARVLPLVSSIAVLALACTGNGSSSQAPSSEWPMYSQNLGRSGANLAETKLTAEAAKNLVVKWKFQTQGPVASSPVIATVPLPGEGSIRLVFAGSYDGNIYAIRASDGKEVWRYAVKPQPGVSYGIVASTPTVAKVDGVWTVFAAGGETMYALDASSGKELWQFDAGTGCTTCDSQTERNEITSSPAVLPSDDLVLFGMDTNDRTPGKGGFYALSAKDGRLRWYFDVDAGRTCHTSNSDNVRKFDGFHPADQLGLTADFLSTRAGCNFDRTETACGNIWSPVAVDTGRKLIYFTTGNCDTDEDPNTPKPPPPMPTYDDAIVALHYDGSPAWTWRPREVDSEDLDFGAGPNLLTATIKGKTRDVVGVGGKDGSYYLLDRDGANETAGRIEPYWSRKVVTGSDIGGFTGTAAVIGETIFAVTAISEGGAPAWALNASDGSVIWSQPDAAAFYGATSAVPELVLTGGVDAHLHIYDARTGNVVAAYPLEGLGFSQAAVVDGVVYIGSGFGALGAGAAELANVPAAVWAFCIKGQEGCSSDTE